MMWVWVDRLRAWWTPPVVSPPPEVTAHIEAMLKAAQAQIDTLTAQMATDRATAAHTLAAIETKAAQLLLEVADNEDVVRAAVQQVRAEAQAHERTAKAAEATLLLTIEQLKQDADLERARLEETWQRELAKQVAQVAKARKTRSGAVPAAVNGTHCRVLTLKIVNGQTHELHECKGDDLVAALTAERDPQVRVRAYSLTTHEHGD